MDATVRMSVITNCPGTNYREETQTCNALTAFTGQMH